MNRDRIRRRSDELAKIRSFVAVDLDAPVVEAIAVLQRQLAEAKADVRWVRPAAMHVTLKFLGAVEPTILERAEVALAQALRAQPVLDVRVRGLGAFPALHRPRVLWVGLQADRMTALARCVDDALVRLGCAPERRAFAPHLTLGRVNSLREWPELLALVDTHHDDDFGDSTVDAVSMYRSVLQPGGSVYTKLWTVPLQHAKGADHDT